MAEKTSKTSPKADEDRAPTPPTPARPAPDNATPDTVTAGGGVVEVDNEHDSTFGDDSTSETTSLASSIYEHKFENGRTYHAYKAGKYIMPNDDQEKDRLDIHHHISLLHLDGELYLAPIGDNPNRILDLGTGTGMWAMDTGDKFPNATVIGVDLSPSQPSWVPPNVQFQVDDIEEEWTYSQPFDFIHARYLSGSVYDWHKLARQCFKFLKPGGWVEFKDWDTRGYTPSGSRELPDSYVKVWTEEIIGACNDLGVTPYAALIIKDVVAAAGFKNMHEKIFPVPCGGWPKDKKLKLIGKFYGITVEEGAPAMSLRLLTQIRKWDVEEVHVLNARFREDIKKFPFYNKYHIIWAQKPLDATSL